MDNAKFAVKCRADFALLHNKMAEEQIKELEMVNFDENKKEYICCLKNLQEHRNL